MRPRERLVRLDHHATAVRARHAAWAACHRAGENAAAIGRRFGVDPSTVRAALDKPRNWRRKNARAA